MFAKNSTSSVQEYINDVPEQRKEIIEFLHNFIQESAPKLEPHFAYNMLGYGSFEYIDKRTKELKSWPVVALANQKNYVSVYVCALEDGAYIAERYKDKLGKVSVGKSCIRLKKLEDVDLEELKKILELAQDSPGLIGLERI